MERKVRVRFAPSPTGALHIGGVRTALFNYLFAKQMGGEMILRIEDTDQTRFVETAEDYIQKALEWVGIELAESPWVGGEYGPYRQSERKAMYMDYAMKLVNDGHAYYAFDTSEELTEMRERLKAARVASPQYNAITRTTMKNSLTLPEDEVKKKLEAGEPYVIRLKVPHKEEIRLNDMVRGWVMVHSSAIDDKVIMKSDGMPTYHLANVVDDYLMKITHVIRGEEWLPSAPLHVLLYKYLGWENEMPEFAHLPLILKPDGNGKLSKRDGDKGGFPIFPLNWDDPVSGNLSEGFKEAGYLPETMVNFLSLLGWSPGNNDEMFTLDQLCEEFSIKRVGKAGTRFDIEKAKWFNQQYLKAKSNEELAEYLLNDLSDKQIECSKEKAAVICGMLKERVVFPTEFVQEAMFFFETPEVYDDKTVRKKWSPIAVEILSEFKDLVVDIEEFTAVKAKQSLIEIVNNKEAKLGAVMPTLRVALTGMGSGPDLLEIMDLLGSAEISKRIAIAIEKLSDRVKS
jgi:glutamyl-tRNA synthetase